MSEVIKRLMTDTTGQDIVQAIEDLSIAVKPNATDIHMSSSDSTSVAQKINNEIATVADGIAIVAEGDVHAAIAEGQFVYVRNHSTLVQGVYKATAAIGTNAALSTSNLTLDNAGGLNDLQAQITSLNSKITIGDVETSTLTQGYFTINYPAGKNYISHIYMLIPMYGTNSLVGWTYTMQTVAQYIVVYVRQGTALPEANSAVSYRLVSIKV